MNNFIKFFLLITGLIALIFILNKNFPQALESDQNKATLISTGLIFSLALSRIAVSNIRISELLNQIILWTVISLILITGYSYKLELKQVFNRVSANLIPGNAQDNPDGSITFYAGDNGHFTINALVNNTTNVNFMLDTGASVVSLSYQDAKNLGINLDNLVFNSPSTTANGVSWSARITIDSIQIGPIILYNVPANVSQKGALDSSLLGMSFLRQLKQFQIEENKLTLEPLATVRFID
jgi:aspartyl protease family protein